MKEKHPNVKVVDVQYGGGDQLKSPDLAKAVIQAHPNLKGFFGANEGLDHSAVLNAVMKELHKEGKIVVIGYDAGSSSKDAVRSGVAAGSGSRRIRVGIGLQVRRGRLPKAIKGEKVQKHHRHRVQWYDKSNVDSEEMKPLLYD